MTIDTKVAAAYTTTSTFETSALKDYSDAVDAFSAAVDAIVARFPDAAKTGVVHQCIAQGRPVNYSLQTLKQQYGLVAPVAPVSTPTA